VAAGAQQISFEIGTGYEPGEYRVVALKGEETVAESTRDIEPEIQIQDVDSTETILTSRGMRSTVRAKLTRRRMERHLLLFRTLEVDQMRSLNSGLLEMFLILSKTPWKWNL